MKKHDAPHPLRIASYNIRKSKGLDQRRDPLRILTVLNRLDADVIALQEADHRMGHRPAALCRNMIATETDFEVAPVAENDVSIGWHGNAIFVRKGLEHSAAKRLVLPGLEPRGAVSVDVAGMTIIATHLGLTRGARRKQLTTITHSLGEDPHAIILGDFNEWSQSKGMEPLADHFTVHAPGRTFHAARPIASLDRIAMTGGLQLNNAGVAQDMLARRASDHLPIWADVSVTR